MLVRGSRRVRRVLKLLVRRTREFAHLPRRGRIGCLRDIFNPGTARVDPVSWIRIGFELFIRGLCRIFACTRVDAREGMERDRG